MMLGVPFYSMITFFDIYIDLTKRAYFNIPFVKGKAGELIRVGFWFTYF
jgi:hypothetical protein